MPRRGNAFSRALGRGLLALGGWRIEGEFPDRPKLVAIVAPHTSNWDFVIGIAAVYALGLRVRFLGKHTLFHPPLGSNAGSRRIARPGPSKTTGRIGTRAATAMW